MYIKDWNLKFKIINFFIFVLQPKTIAVIVGLDSLLPGNVEKQLELLVTEVHYPKGHILFSCDKLERNIYIIRQGIARAYVEADGRDVTIWFGQEGDVVISAQGYVYGEKGYETMELVEDSVLYKIGWQELLELYRHDIDVCNWARQLLEREFVKTEQRLISHLSESATERYLHLMREKPGIIRRVQLQHIASYLGISSEHLSRIRTNTKNHPL